MSEIQWIPLNELDSHPDNPRLELREDLITSIQAHLQQDGFQEKNAVIVRRLGKRFQILNGHHRVQAAARAGLKNIPAWVGEYTDEEAFMQLVLANAQRELTLLERGRHAAKAIKKYSQNGNSVGSYAAKISGVEKGTQAEKDSARQQVSQQIRAFEVYEKFEDIFQTGANRYFRDCQKISITS
jgi:ParB/RepB/Spo0J family partition protein